MGTLDMDQIRNTLLQAQAMVTKTGLAPLAQEVEPRLQAAMQRKHGSPEDPR
jgi:hypothetical protein